MANPQEIEVNVKAGAAAAELSRLDETLRKQAASVEDLGRQYEELNSHLADVEERLRGVNQEGGNTAVLDGVKRHKEEVARLRESYEQLSRTLEDNKQKMESLHAQAASTSSSSSPSAASSPATTPPSSSASESSGVPDPSLLDRVIGPLGTLITLIGLVKDHWKELSSLFLKLGAGIAAVLGTVGAALTRISGPIGAVVATVQTIGAISEKYSAVAASARELDQALASQGRLTDEYRTRLQELSSELAKVYGSREQWTEVMASLSDAGGSSTDIEAAASAVQQLAVALGGDLSTATDIVSEGLRGNFEEFEKLGIRINDTASESEKLQQAFNGIEDLGGGDISLVGAEWQKFKAIISDVATGIGTVFSRVAGAVSNFFGFIKDSIVDFAANFKPFVAGMKVVNWVVGGVTKVLPSTVDEDENEDYSGEQGKAKSSAEHYAEALKKLGQEAQAAASGQETMIEAARRSQQEFERLTAEIDRTTQALLKLNGISTEFELAANEHEVATGLTTPDDGRRNAINIKESKALEGFAIEEKALQQKLGNLESRETSAKYEAEQAQAKHNAVKDELHALPNDLRTPSVRKRRAELQRQYEPTNEKAQQAKAISDVATKEYEEKAPSLRFELEGIPARRETVKRKAASERVRLERDIEHRRRLRDHDQNIATARLNDDPRQVQQLEQSKAWLQKYQSVYEQTNDENLAQEAGNTVVQEMRKKREEQTRVIDQEEQVATARSQGNELDARKLEAQMTAKQRYDHVFNTTGDKERADRAYNLSLNSSSAAEEARQKDARLGLEAQVARSWGDVETARRIEMEREFNTTYQQNLALGLTKEEALDGAGAKVRENAKTDFSQYVTSQTSAATAMHLAGMGITAQSDADKVVDAIRNGFENANTRLEQLIDKPTEPLRFGP